MDEQEAHATTNETNIEAQPVTDERDSQIQTLKAQIAALTAQAKEEIQALKLQAAVTEVNKPDSKPLANGQADVKREAAIRAAGGLARWNQMPVQQREAILGASDNVQDAELHKYFGKGSNGAEASRLAKFNPAKYASYRVLAIERGIY